MNTTPISKQPWQCKKPKNPLDFDETVSQVTSNSHMGQSISFSGILPAKIFPLAIPTAKSDTKYELSQNLIDTLGSFYTGHDHILALLFITKASAYKYFALNHFLKMRDAVKADECAISVMALDNKRLDFLLLSGDWHQTLTKLTEAKIGFTDMDMRNSLDGLENLRVSLKP